MSANLRRGVLLGGVGLMLAGGIAWAAVEYPNAGGGTLTSIVIHWLNPSNQGVPASAANPLPVADAAARSSLTTIATNTGGSATAANQVSQTNALTTIATNTSSGATAANQATQTAALGAPSDAAYGGSGNASLVAALKGVYAQLAAVMTTKPAATSTLVTTPVTVGTSSVSLASAGTMTRGWRVMNLTTVGSGYIDLCWGATCTLGQGFARVYPGASDDWKSIVPPAGIALSAIASASGQTISITVAN